MGSVLVAVVFLGGREGACREARPLSERTAR